MKKAYLLIALNTLFIILNAQNFEWAKREGLWAYDYGYGITTDNSGNVYVAGKYEEVNSNFSGTLIPCAGNHDIFVAQYSSAGALNWIRTGGGTSGDYAKAIACDNAFVYIAGEIQGYNETIYFPGSSTTLISEGEDDIFLAKYDLSGNLIWARRDGGIGDDEANGIAYDASGNVYVCGYYDASPTFGGTTTINSVGGDDIFVAKYDANGNFLWVRNAGGPGRDEPKSIKCDAAGNVYICGMYSAGCAFGTQTLSTYNNTAYFDAFIAKYASDGTLQWVKTAGGDYDDVAWSMTMDNAGQLFITGEFNGYAEFGSHSLTTSGFAQAFVAAYDASGTALWAKQAGGMMPTGNLVTRARGIGCDGNNLYITGQFGATATFGPFTLTAVDSSDVFVAGLSNTGTFLNAASVGGPADAFEGLGYESGVAICADASGNAFVTGSLLDGGVFGSTVLTAHGRTDVFIAKISQLTGLNDFADNEKNIPVYPNPSSGKFTLNVDKLSGQVIELTITNCLGQVIDKRTDKVSSMMNIDLSAQENGIYFIEIKSEDQSVSRGKIVLQ